MTVPKPTEIADAVVDLILRLRIHATCLSCEHFNPVTEGCAKAFGQRPPAQIIVTGCPSYQEILPF